MSLNDEKFQDQVNWPDPESVEGICWRENERLANQFHTSLLHPALNIPLTHAGQCRETQYTGYPPPP